MYIVRVYQLLFDARHNVLMTRLHGTYVEDDITVRDEAVTRFVRRHGPARGIMDFTDVEAVDVRIDFVIKRAHEPPRLPGQPRAIVAPHDLVYGFNRVIAAHQLFSRNVEPLMVRTLDEAYRAFNIIDPQFEPVEDDKATLLDGPVARMLAKIDRAKSAELSAEAERQALREKMLRLLDTVLLRPPVQSLREPRVITLSDILNASLKRTRLSDADLVARCANCRRDLSLSACKITAGPETTYACPNCRAVLVSLAPDPGGRRLPEHGYVLGSFVVRPAVDIECCGARLGKAPIATDRRKRS